MPIIVGIDYHSNNGKITYGDEMNKQQFEQKTCVDWSKNCSCGRVLSFESIEILDSPNDKNALWYNCECKTTGIIPLSKYKNGALNE